MKTNDWVEMFGHKEHIEIVRQKAIGFIYFVVVSGLLTFFMVNICD